MTNTNTQESTKKWWDSHVIVATVPTSEKEAKAEMKKPIASGKIEIKRGAKGAKRNGMKAALPEVTEEMKVQCADVIANNTPRNGISKREYTGENAYRLAMTMKALGLADNRWYTFNQLQGIGARIKKGEHGTKIWGWWYRKSDDAELIELTEEEAKAVRKVHPKIYVLFNAEQCTGITAQAPEAVATVATVAETAETKTEEKKYKVIRGSFEIKPKAKKAKKTEAKAPEAKKPEEVTEAKKAAPVATEATEKQLAYYRAALDVLGRLKLAAVKWNKKVYNRRFLEALVKAAVGEKGDDVKIYSHTCTGYTENGVYVQVYMTNTVFKSTGHGLEIDINMPEESGDRQIFRAYTSELFTTTEAGKKPRVDAVKFLAIAGKEEDAFRNYIKAAEETVAAEEEIKNAVAEIQRLRKLLGNYDVLTLATQGYTDGNGFSVSI